MQTIDLSGAATDIDAGRVKFYLSGYLGFIAGSYDTIYQINLKAEFQDASGKALLTSTAAGPTSADISVAAGLLPRTAQGFLPANVRKAKITIDLYTGSSGRNGYAADNISLVLTAEPVFGVNLLVNGDAETDPRTRRWHGGARLERGHQLWRPGNTAIIRCRRRPIRARATAARSS